MTKNIDLFHDIQIFYVPICQSTRQNSTHNPLRKIFFTSMKVGPLQLMKTQHQLQSNITKFHKIEQETEYLKQDSNEMCRGARAIPSFPLPNNSPFCFFLVNGGLQTTFRCIPHPIVQECATSCPFKCAHNLFINPV